MTAVKERIWILTNKKKQFDLLNPTEDMIDIEEIALALSQCCRYTGHPEPFYSVGLHSLILSDIVPAEFALEGLLHDAAEAYLGDVSKPLKRLLPDYRKIEARVNIPIAKKFKLKPEAQVFVDNADKLIYMQESDFFFGQHEFFDVDMQGLLFADNAYMFDEGKNMKEIERSFLIRFKQLWKQRHGRNWE